MNPFINALEIYRTPVEFRSLLHVLAQEKTVCVCMCVFALSEGVSLRKGKMRTDGALSGSLKDSVLPLSPSKNLAV